MLTRKDYIAIARMIKDNSGIANMRRGVTHIIKEGQFVNELCEYLQKDNPNFNEVKFRDATGQILGQNKVA
jgi:hypothetical protein